MRAVRIFLDFLVVACDCGVVKHLFLRILLVLVTFLLHFDVTFQGKCEEAEPLYKHSLAIDKKVYGPDQPEVATDLNNLVC